MVVFKRKLSNIKKNEVKNFDFFIIFCVIVVKNELNCYICQVVLAKE